MTVDIYTDYNNGSISHIENSAHFKIDLIYETAYTEVDDHYVSDCRF